jgi:ankyrin repeat protein
VRKVELPSIDISDVQARLKAGVKPNEMFSSAGDGQLLICEACANGQLNVVELLVNNQANLKPVSTSAGHHDHANSPLATAVHFNHYDIAKFLLEKGADANCDVRTDTVFQRTALADALFQKNWRMAALLRAYGASVNPDINRIEYFSSKNVEAILKEGVKDASIGFFHLPSPKQVGLKEVENVIKILKKYGGSINEYVDLPDIGIHVPLTYAVEHNYDVDVAQLLLKHGALIERGSWGLQTASPLYMAATLGNFKMVKMLVEHGALIDGGHYWGITPLSAAASCGEAGCNSANAPRSEYIKIVKFLIAHGAKVNTHNEKYGTTPLIWAVMANCLEIVEILIEHGADIHWTKESHYDSDPPIEIARAKKYEEVLQILEKALHKRLNPC